MNYKYSFALITLILVGTVFVVLPTPHKSSASQAVVAPVSESRREVRIEIISDVTAVKYEAETPVENSIEIIDEGTDVFTVPFFSQFEDITSVEWKKVGCGIASLAMLIEFYKPGSVSVDKLLKDGISSGAYLSDAGWTHAGLINLSKQFGLSGESKSLADLSMSTAFNKLETVVSEGPVMVSVHYTFEPTNPIPHLVVVNGVHDGKVFYNDPAEVSGGGSISIEKFKSAWKKRYISIRPV